jgi:hypothetical protein
MEFPWKYETRLMASSTSFASTPNKKQHSSQHSMRGDAGSTNAARPSAHLPAGPRAP